MGVNNPSQPVPAHLPPFPSQPVVIPPAAEPGYTTTEFWGKVAVQAIGLLTLFGVIHLGSAQSDAVTGMVALVAPELVYAVARAVRKSGTSG